MSKTNKRTLADPESTPFPSTKRARTQLAAPLPPATDNALQTPSSPTLIGSISTSPPSQSPQSSLIDATDSATSSSTSTTTSSSVEPSSSEFSSSDDSSSNSETRYMQNHIIPVYPVPDSTSTSDTETTSSCPTSTSASIADDVSGSSSSSPTSTSASTTDVDSASSSSASNSQSSSASISSSSSSSEESASSSSDMRRTLTAKNLATLQRRLYSLLPEIQSANELLEVERQEGRLEERNIENVANEDAEGGGKAYIAMDLGLGVLEERRGMRAEAHKMGTSSGSEIDAPSGQLGILRDEEGNVIWKHMGTIEPGAHKMGTTRGSDTDTSSGQQESLRDDNGNVIEMVTRTRGLGGKRKAGIEEVGSG